MPRSEAPWEKLKAESYSLFLKLSELPKGTYDEFEASWADEKENGAFKGGLGAVIVVRYSETPVGMFDSSFHPQIPYHTRIRRQLYLQRYIHTPNSF